MFHASPDGNINNSSRICKTDGDSGQTTACKTEETGKFQESQLTRVDTQNGTHCGNQCWVGEAEPKWTICERLNVDKSAS